MPTEVSGLSAQQYRDYITQQTKVSSASGEFSVDDFYGLLAAQLKNQDLYNAQDDTKFLEQMVQIYNIQNMKEMSAVMAEMNQMTMTSYAFEFMGKEVTVATLDKKGELTQVTGVVEKVILYNGEPQVYVDGQPYGLGSVMEVFPAKQEDDDKDDKIEELEEEIEMLKEMLAQAGAQNGTTAGGVTETPEDEETEGVEESEGTEEVVPDDIARPESTEGVDENVSEESADTGVTEA